VVITIISGIGRQSLVKLPETAILKQGEIHPYHRNFWMKNPSASPAALTGWIDDFLTDLENANRSEHTYRAYKSDLAVFAYFNENPETAFRVDSLRAFMSRFSHLKPATRARKQAALSSFCRWAYQHELIANNPMDLLEAREVRATPTTRYRSSVCREDIQRDSYKPA
jgi:hypothetical protein